MRMPALAVSAVAVATGLTWLTMGSSGAAGGTGVYADWSVSGSSATATLNGTVFPTITASRTGGSWQVASGSSTWLSADTPFGAQFGSSRNRDYLFTSLPLGASGTVVTVTFATPTPAGTWGFALGDVDAEDITVAATGADGEALDVSGWFQSAFNSCTVSPRPPACPAGTHTDQPTWAAPVLRGSSSDTNGAAAWFRPTSSVKTLTFSQVRSVAGAPVYQLWIASDIVSATASSTASASPASASPTDSTSPADSTSASESASPSPSTSTSPTVATAVDGTAPEESSEPSPTVGGEDSSTAVDLPAPVIVRPDTTTVIDVIAASGADPGSTLTGVDVPRHGTAQIQDNTVLYTPTPGFIGRDVIVSYIENPGGEVVLVRTRVSTGLVQKPVKPLGLPSSVAPNRTVVLLDHAVVTNAGQTARVRTECQQVTRIAPFGGFSGCMVTRDGSTVMVTVTGSTPYRVRVTVSAPAKGDYLPYAFSRVYTVRP